MKDLVYNPGDFKLLIIGFNMILKTYPVFKNKFYINEIFINHTVFSIMKLGNLFPTINSIALDILKQRKLIKHLICENYYINRIK